MLRKSTYHAQHSFSPLAFVQSAHPLLKGFLRYFHNVFYATACCRRTLAQVFMHKRPVPMENLHPSLKMLRSKRNHHSCMWMPDWRRFNSHPIFLTVQNQQHLSIYHMKPFQEALRPMRCWKLYSHFIERWVLNQVLHKVHDMCRKRWCRWMTTQAIPYNLLYTPNNPVQSRKQRFWCILHSFLMLYVRSFVWHLSWKHPHYTSQWLTKSEPIHFTPNKSARFGSNMQAFRVGNMSAKDQPPVGRPWKSSLKRPPSIHTTLFCYGCSARLWTGLELSVATTFSSTNDSRDLTHLVRPPRSGSRHFAMCLIAQMIEISLPFSMCAPKVDDLPRKTLVLRCSSCRVPL